PWRAVAAIGLQAPAAGSELVRAGYGRDRAHLLAMHRGCRIVGEAAGILSHSCDSALGDSGSPLLLFRRGVPTLVGMQVAVVSRPEGRLGPAVPASAFDAPARAALGAR